MNIDNDAFSLGRSDGYAAGVAGKQALPKPDPLLYERDPANRDQYLQGSALGFDQGVRQREEVHIRAEADLENDRER